MGFSRAPENRNSGGRGGGMSKSKIVEPHACATGSNDQTRKNVSTEKKCLVTRYVICERALISVDRYKCTLYPCVHRARALCDGAINDTWPLLLSVNASIERSSAKDSGATHETTHALAAHEARDARQFIFRCQDDWWIVCRFQVIHTCNRKR